MARREDTGVAGRRLVREDVTAPTVGEQRDLDVVVVGDINPDILVTGGEPRYGQREVIVDAIAMTIGGSAGIMATAAAALGLRVAIVGVVGDDVFGRFMVDELRDRGVDVKQVRVDPDRPTGATVILARPTDRAILTAEGTIADVGADDVPSSLLARTRHVHVASYFLQPALRAALPDVVARAHAAGTTISVDPNWDPVESWDGGLSALLPTLDLFFPNEEEARRITGRATASDAARALRGERGGPGPIVVVKRGAEGALAINADGEETSIAAFEIEPLDSTGAGDAFDAGFLRAWLEGQPTSTCVSEAAAAGALSTRGLGGTSSLPTTADIDALVGGGRQGR